MRTTAAARRFARRITVTATSLFLAFVAAGPVLADMGTSQTIPTQSGPSVAAQKADIPQVSTPALPDAARQQTRVAPRYVTTPNVESKKVAISEIAVPSTCAGSLVCVGAFTVPAKTVAATPNIGSKTVATPQVTIPAVCPMWPCTGVSAGGWSQGLTPAINVGPLTPPITVTATLAEPQPLASAESGQRLVAPVSRDVYVPGIGAIPVTLFPQGIDAPVAVGARTQLTLQVLVGTKAYGTTVPVTI